jgi:RHS repeat-associated protein
MVVEYEYYINGKLKKQSWGTANANRVIDSFWGSVSKKIFTGESGTERKELYSYNDYGQLTKVETYNGTNILIRTASYDYDTVTGRLVAVNSPEGRIEYETNAYGQLTRVRTSTGINTEYRYDQFGRLKRVIDQGLSTSADERKQFEYHYDKFDNKDLVKSPNGTEVDYGYDQGIGWLTDITHKKESVELLKLDYLDRDKTGLIKSVVEIRKDDEGTELKNQKWTYNYDGLKRLVDATLKDAQENTLKSYSYEYDRNGNRTKKTVDGGAPVEYEYDSLDQLISAGSSSYDYDKYGRLVKETKGNGDYQTYTWSVDDELTKAQFYYSGGSLYQTVSYTYDYQGTRVSRDVEGGTEDGQYLAYLTDYQNLTGYSQTLAEVDRTATKVSRNYFYGSELLGQRSGSASAADPYFLDPENPSNDQLAFLHGDHLASTRLLTDVGGGIYGDNYDTSAMDFSPYGELLGGTGSLTSYRFTGQYYDALLSLQYHRARWLNPITANWLSTDPLFDFPDNFGNLYSYAGNNPVWRVDLSGQFGSLTEACVSLAIKAGLATMFLGTIGGGVAALIDKGIEAFVPGLLQGLKWGAIIGAMITFAILGAAYFGGYAASLVSLKLIASFFTGFNLGVFLSKNYSKGTRIVAAAFLLISLSLMIFPARGGSPPQTAFTDRWSFSKLANELAEAAQSEGAKANDLMGIRGSALSGRSAAKGTEFGSQSDVDFYLVSDELYSKAGGRRGGTHVPPKLMDRLPRIQAWEQQSSRMVGREVSVRVYSRYGYKVKVVDEATGLGGPYFDGEISVKY